MTAIIECGAHEASASREFLKNNPDGEALAVEANPYTFREKTHAAKLDGVRVLNAGVGASRGSAQFHIPLKPDGSITPPDASFLKRELDNHPYREVTVDVETVDSLRSRLNRNKALALWLDVEGQTLEVLKGAHESLHGGQVKIVFLEAEVKRKWKEQVLFPEVAAYLMECGYVPVACDGELFPNQFNVLWVRKDQFLMLEEQVVAAWRKISRTTPWFVCSMWLQHAISRLHPAWSTSKCGSGTA